MPHQLNGAQGSARELRAVKRYFAPFPKWVVFATGLALVAIALGASEATRIRLAGAGAPDELDELVVAAGVGLLAIGVLRLALWSVRPSGEQIDRWLARDLSRLKMRAIERCGLTGLTLTSETVVLTGPRFNVAGAELGYRRARREATRFTPVGVTVLNFTEHQIFAYQCALDRLTGSALAEQTDEFFYRDVVSVSTRTDDLTIDKRHITRTGRRLLAAQIRAGKL